MRHRFATLLLVFVLLAGGAVSRSVSALAKVSEPPQPCIVGNRDMALSQFDDLVRSLDARAQPLHADLGGVCYGLYVDPDALLSRG